MLALLVFKKVATLILSFTRTHRKPSMGKDFGRLSRSVCLNRSWDILGSKKEGICNPCSPNVTCHRVTASPCHEFLTCAPHVCCLPVTAQHFLNSAGPGPRRPRWSRFDGLDLLKGRRFCEVSSFRSGQHVMWRFVLYRCVIFLFVEQSCLLHDLI